MPITQPTSKIPKPVPFDDVDPSKKELYNELKKVREDELKALEKPLDDEEDRNLPEFQVSFDSLLQPLQIEIKRLQERVATLEKPTEPVYSISDDDKAAFQRAILANIPFTKQYVLFGSIEVSFQDLPHAGAVEVLSTSVNRWVKDGLVEIETTDEWAVWFERLYLVTSLINISGFENAEHIIRNDNTKIEIIKKLLDLCPKPVYQATLAAYRDFTKLVTELTEKGLDGPFWQADVGSLQQKPILAVLSILEKPTDTTHVG